MKLYRITPLEKKNVEYLIDAYEQLEDGSTRGFTVREIWRWGLGYREEDDLVTEYDYHSQTIYCDPDVGYGAELDDLITVYFDWSDEFTEEERQDIESRWHDAVEDEEGRWGTAWLYDGDHNFSVDHSSVTITGPVKIDLLDENGELIEENVAPKKETVDLSWKTVPDDEMKVWPVPIESGFGEKDKTS